MDGENEIFEGAAQRYLGEVDDLFRERIGIAYSEIAQDLHGGGDFVDRARRDRVEPETFVESVVHLAKFFVLDQVRPDIAHRVAVVNRGRAALIGYARKSEAWKPGTDGNVWLRSEDDRVFRLRAQYSRGRSVVFAVDELVSGEVSYDENPVTVSVDTRLEFEDLGRGADITEAVQRVEARLEEAAAQAPGM